MFRGKWAIYHQRTRTSTGQVDRASAETFLKDYIDALDRPQGARPTVAAILERYLANRREAEKKGVERIFWSHKQLTRLLGDKAADSLSKPDFAGYKATRLGEGVTENTVRTEFTALRAALRWAAVDKLIPEAPVVPMPPKGQPRERWLTRDEAAKILDACSRQHVKMFVLLALHTGARSGAILALTWDRVDLETRRVDMRLPGEIQSRKRKVPVPINDTLFAALMAAKERRTCMAVVEFAGRAVASVKHGVRDAAARAGLPGITPHVFRHTAATWMAQARVPLWEIAGMLGHTNPRMLEETYGHHHPDHLANAAKALG
jgi:integrase